MLAASHQVVLFGQRLLHLCLLATVSSRLSPRDCLLATALSRGLVRALVRLPVGWRGIGRQSHSKSNERAAARFVTTTGDPLAVHFEWNLEIKDVISGR